MTNREQILSQVSKNKPTSTDAPSMKMYESELPIDLQSKFTEMLKKISGNAISLENGDDINNVLKSRFPDFPVVVSNIPEIDFTTENLHDISSPLELQNVDLAILKGAFGIAENGAVWVTGESMLHYALPFITQHLVLVINKNDIVENMHLAYNKVEIKRPGYGVFIAGPSKTADIEQSLVIGAHGSRSLLVILQ